MRKILGASLVILAAIAAYATYYFVYELPLRELKIRGGESYTLYVKPGSSLHSTLAGMQREGLVKYPKAIAVYARLFDKTHIKTGEYLFKRHDTVADVLEKLNAGIVNYQSITLIEGWNLKQIMARVDAEFGVKIKADELAVAAGVEGSLEGWIFPDTYYFSASDNPEKVLTQAIKKMQTLLQQQWQLRDADLPYETPYELLIMASLIEKETGADSEREQIASVFINRLRKNMRLQTDPTVIYGMGEQYDGNIRRADLRRPTPYNTYVIKGLPPTPIAMPSRRSLEAAAKPASTNYVYFVAKGNGEHQFSVSLAEHNSAVDKYQRYSRVKDYQSAPSATP